MLIHNKDAAYNLLLMTVCWVSTTFMYFLVIFLVKYLPGNFFINQIVSGFSCFGYLLAPLLANKFDNRKIIILGYIVSLIFLIVMLIVEYATINAVVYSFIFLLFKCGVSLSFLSLFVIHYDLFETQFIATSYGICNIVSRLITLGAPITAEMSNSKIPIYIMLLMNILALVAAYFLKLNPSKMNS